MIIILLLILRNYNKHIITNKLLGGSTSHLMIDNFTLVIRYKIYEFWNNLHKGKILVLSIIFILLYTYLVSKKQTFMCFGCSKGDWWYKCDNGTGYNSMGCNSYTKVHDVLSHVINSGFETVDTIKKVLFESINSIKISKERITNLISRMNFIIDLPIDVPPIPMIQIENFSCSSKVSINEHFDFETPDVCDVLKTIMNEPFKGLKPLIEEALNGIITPFKHFWNLLKDVINLIVTAVAKAMGVMILPFHTLLGLLVDLKRTFEFILYTIKKLGIFNMVLFNFANFIKSIFPIKNFGTLIAVTSLVFVVFILFPLIGGIAAGCRAFISIFNGVYSIFTVPFEFIGNEMENYEPSNNVYV